MTNLAEGDPLVGRTLLGKLQIIRPIGRGGMGAVYEVEHTVTGHRRALKVLHPGMADPEVLARFAREARVSALVKSRYVVETFDAGVTEDGAAYVLMEMLEGRALSRLLAEQRRVAPDVVVELFAQVCEGIAAAHDVGIVHRDLKPDNLFLVRDEHGREHIKILDFGISKFSEHKSGAFDGTLTNEGALLGTPYYMSPEQVSALKDIDARCDVYALGVMMYEALSGTRPFDAATFTALVVKIHEGSCEPLASLAPDVSPLLVATVERAMSKDRVRRFSSARALAAALREASASDDPGARASWADSGRLVSTLGAGRERLVPATAPARSRVSWLAALGGAAIAAIGISATAVVLVGSAAEPENPAPVDDSRRAQARTPRSAATDAPIVAPLHTDPVATTPEDDIAPTQALPSTVADPVERTDAARAEGVADAGTRLSRRSSVGPTPVRVLAPSSSTRLPSGTRRSGTPAVDRDYPEK